MRVLLCSPYEEGKEIVFGGITIWTRNITNYYKSITTDSVQIAIQPFDRITFVSHKISKIKRCYYGIKEYYVAIKKAKKTLQKDRYDIIHLNSSASISLFKDLWMIYIAHKYHTKIAIHFHFGRIPEIRKKNNWEWRMTKFVLKNADSVILMDFKSYYVLKKTGYSNISYLPNPLAKSIQNQIKTESTAINKIPRTILFVGHVIKTKGVLELAEATKGLDYVSLRIVGRCTDEMKKELLSINSNMTLLGEITHDNVIKEMLASDIFVLPSYTEGFPNVILESMASGCAIIGTSVGAMPEMLDCTSTSPCGIIVPPQNIEKLHSAIKELLGDVKLRNRLRINAIKRVNEMYSVEVVWNHLNIIWKNILNKTPSVNISF